MQGQILGFDGTSGAIRGEDDARYRFELADWKSARPPQARDQVDFISDAEGVAREVYLLKAASIAGALPAVDLQGSGRALQEKLALASSSGIGATLIARARAMPAAVVALVILIASFLFQYARIGGYGEFKLAEGNLVSMAGSISDYGAIIDSGLKEVRALAEFMGPADGDAVSAMESLSFIAGLSWFLYLIPPLAAYVVYCGYRENRMRAAELALGGLCILAGGYYWVLRATVAGMADAIPFGGATLGSMISFGFGGWLIVLSGIAMILLSLGVVKVGQHGSNPETPETTA